MCHNRSLAIHSIPFTFLVLCSIRIRVISLSSLCSKNPEWPFSLSLSPIKWHTNERNAGTAYALRENLTRCREYVVLLRMHTSLCLSRFSRQSWAAQHRFIRDLQKYLGCPRDVQIGWRSRFSHTICAADSRWQLLALIFYTEKTPARPWLVQDQIGRKTHTHTQHRKISLTFPVGTRHLAEWFLCI